MIKHDLSQFILKIFFWDVHEGAIFLYYSLQFSRNDLNNKK